jgi:hypothetical protein
MEDSLVAAAAASATAAHAAATASPTAAMWRNSPTATAPLPPLAPPRPCEETLPWAGNQTERELQTIEPKWPLTWIELSDFVVVST